MTKYQVEMFVNGEWWYYGKWSNRDLANQAAIEVRDERGVWVRVLEVQG